MSDTYMSVAQIADKAQSNKTKVFRTIKTLGITPDKTSNGAFRFTDAQAQQIIDAISASQQERTAETPATPDPELVAVLKAQIAAQNEEIQRLHKALDQEQQLHLAEQQKVKLLEADTTKHWWQKLFGTQK